MSESPLPTPPRLLAVFAHPDDEQWGTAGALLACAERGIEVHLLTATSGDAGEISDPALATPETLGAVREEELRLACRILGLHEPTLLGYADGRLSAVAPDELTARVAHAIRRLRPRVVLTFDENGGYGHPDHIAIHRATVAAFDRAADPGYSLPAAIDPHGLAPHRADKLYATAYPRSLFEHMNAGFVAAGLPPIDFGSVQTVAAHEIGTPDERVTTAVPVDRFWDRRWSALLAHRTQYGPNNPFVAVGAATVRSWLRCDRFRRIVPEPAPGASLPDEDDLWSGLDLPSRSGDTR